MKFYSQNIKTHHTHRLDVLAECLPASVLTKNADAHTNGQGLPCSKSPKGGNLLGYLTTTSPDARVNFSVESNIAGRALLMQQKTYVSASSL